MSHLSNLNTKSLSTSNSNVSNYTNCIWVPFFQPAPLPGQVVTVEGLKIETTPQNIDLNKCIAAEAKLGSALLLSSHNWGLICKHSDLNSTWIHTHKTTETLLTNSYRFNLLTCKMLRTSHGDNNQSRQPLAAHWRLLDCCDSPHGAAVWNPVLWGFVISCSFWSMIEYSLATGHTVFPRLTLSDAGFSMCASTHISFSYPRSWHAEQME